MLQHAFLSSVCCPLLRQSKGQEVKVISTQKEEIKKWIFFSATVL